MTRDPVHLHLHLHGVVEGRPTDIVITIPLSRVIIGFCVAVPSTVLTVIKISSLIRGV